MINYPCNVYHPDFYKILQNSLLWKLSVETLCGNSLWKLSSSASLSILGPWELAAMWALCPTSTSLWSCAGSKGQAAGVDTGVLVVFI